MMDGRVKTLIQNPRRSSLLEGQCQHRDAVPSHIKMIDLVVVNLYPFEDTVAKDVFLGEAIEQIDIGGRPCSEGR